MKLKIPDSISLDQRFAYVAGYKRAIHEACHYLKGAGMEQIAADVYNNCGITGEFTVTTTVEVE